MIISHPGARRDPAERVWRQHYPNVAGDWERAQRIAERSPGSATGVMVLCTLCNAARGAGAATVNGRPMRWADSAEPVRGGDLVQGATYAFDPDAQTVRHVA